MLEPPAAPGLAEPGLGGEDDLVPRRVEAAGQGQGPGDVGQRHRLGDEEDPRSTAAVEASPAGRGPGHFSRAGTSIAVKSSRVGGTSAKRKGVIWASACSRTSTIRWKKRAAWAPAITRRSKFRVRKNVGRTSTLVPTATGRGLTRPNETPIGCGQVAEDGVDAVLRRGADQRRAAPILDPVPGE